MSTGGYVRKAVAHLASDRKFCADVLFEDLPLQPFDPCSHETCWPLSPDVCGHCELPRSQWADNDCLDRRGPPPEGWYRVEVTDDEGRLLAWADVPGPRQIAADGDS